MVTTRINLPTYFYCAVEKNVGEQVFSKVTTRILGHFCTQINLLRDHPFKTSACLRGEGVSPCADDQKFTVHKDQKSPS